MKRLLVLGLFFLAGGCSGSDKPEDAELPLPGVDCMKETVPTYAQVALFQKTCVKCHSSSNTGDMRKGSGANISAKAAPDDVNFDTFAEAKKSAIPAAQELYEDARGAMPPEDSKLDAATETEKRQVLVWAKCGTPQ